MPRQRADVVAVLQLLQVGRIGVHVLLIGLGITGGLATGAFAVQMWVQQFVPAQQEALVFESEPAFAAWLSWYFLGETLDLQGWIGSGLILLAVVIGAFESRKQPPPDEMAQPA